MKFADLGLIDPILKAAADIGYEEPSPIQAQAIPPVLTGKDLIGCAQTGTGKTAAFAMPVIQRLSSEEAPGWCPTRALILTPTRELALQICESFEAYEKYLPLKVTVVFGGVPQHPQEVALRHGVDTLVATPGRLLDLVGQQLVDLQQIEMFVLDEADRMLDMGFLPDVKRVISLLPKERQTLLFSATMPEEIASLAQSILKDPVRVAVDPVSSTVDAIEQEVLFVSKENKRALLADRLRARTFKNALVFVRTKHGADKVARDLNRDGIRADSIHGDKTQAARQYALSSFKDGTIRVLVATDIAARGIDIDELECVINYDMPSPAENYVHRIGRTGRAGRSGLALSFCDASEYPYLLDIEKLTNKRIPVVSDHPYALEEPSVGRKGKQVRPVNRPEKNSAPTEAKKSETKREEKKPAPKKAEDRSQEKVAPVREKAPAKAVGEPRQKPEKVRQPLRAEAPAVVSVPTAETELAQTSDAILPKVSLTGREVRIVESNDQLPVPPEGRLLNSFADTGIDYYMTENPTAANDVIAGLGFYNPPRGALKEIYGEEYDGTDPDFTIVTDSAPVVIQPKKSRTVSSEEENSREKQERSEKRSRNNHRRPGKNRPRTEAAPETEPAAETLPQELTAVEGQEDSRKKSGGNYRHRNRPRHHSRNRNSGAPKDDISTRNSQPFYGAE